MDVMNGEEVAAEAGTWSSSSREGRRIDILEKATLLVLVSS